MTETSGPQWELCDFRIISEVIHQPPDICWGFQPDSHHQIVPEGTRSGVSPPLPSIFHERPKQALNTNGKEKAGVCFRGQPLQKAHSLACYSVTTWAEQIGTLETKF